MVAGFGERRQLPREAEIAVEARICRRQFDNQTWFTAQLCPLVKGGDVDNARGEV